VTCEDKQPHERVTTSPESTSGDKQTTKQPGTFGARHCDSRHTTMEEQDRITITICGDGGCGTPNLGPRSHHTLTLPQERAP
jgi:hypothetical protein